MKVTFETTPNPATMKFVLSSSIMESGVDFKNAQESEKSPLAAKIFGFPWTSGVYLGPDFITVTKQDWVDWDVLAEPLANLICQHLVDGEPVYIDIDPETSHDENENDPPLIKDIKRTLDREIRPVVAMDGGDVVFAKLEDDILYLHMKGACAGCPSASATLKEGIEVRIKELFPGIKEVRSFNF